jgi:hypothetical protein
MLLPRPGSEILVIAGATAGTTVIVDNTLGADLLIMHEITGGSTGGEIIPKCSIGGSASNLIPFHGDATGLPSGKVTASYSAILRSTSQFVALVLSVTDGTHNVYVQSLIR